MNRRVALLAVAAVALLVAGWFVYEIVDTDAPDEVSTDAALEQLQTEAAAESSDESDAGAADEGVQADAPPEAGE